MILKFQIVPISACTQYAKTVLKATLIYFFDLQNLAVLYYHITVAFTEYIQMRTPGTSF